MATLIAVLTMLHAGVQQAGHTLVNKQFFDTLTINPHVDSDVIVQQAREKEINLRYFPSGMVSEVILYFSVISYISARQVYVSILRADCNDDCL